MSGSVVRVLQPDAQPVLRRERAVLSYLLTQPQPVIATMEELEAKMGTPSYATIYRALCGLRAAGVVYFEPQGTKSHGFSHHPNYSRHGNMMQRCYNMAYYNYSDYGGRGISVYEPWHDVATFCNWLDANLGPCPDGYSIDRINNDRGYYPDNVRWADTRTQLLNRRPRKARG